MSIIDGKEFALKLAARRGGPGRKQVASDAHKANNYRDENGQYQLAGEMQPWHYRVADVMISQPHAKIKDVAAFLGVSAGWLGQLIKTDAFKEYYQMRLASHQEEVGTEIIGKMQSVATKALDKLDEALDQPEVTFTQVRESADIALKALGYTQPRGGVNVAVQGGQGGDTTVQIGVSSDVVARARQKWQSNLSEGSRDVNPDNYAYVTASDRPSEEIEDAVLLDDNDEPTKGIQTL